MGKASPPSVASESGSPRSQPTDQPTDERAALTSRTIPTMTLSTANNPLTAPIPSLKSSDTVPFHSPRPRALARFSTPGTAVLTGGAGTLALASARALFEHGTSMITLMDLPSTFRSSAAAIEALHSDFPDRKITQVTVDVTSASEVSRAFDEAASLMGNRIDMLACFAGVVGCVHAVDMTAEQWRKIMDVNVTGSFLCAQAAARHMMAQNDRRLEEIQEATLTAERSTNSTTISGQEQKDLFATTQIHNGVPAYSILFTSSISAHATNYPQPQSAYNASKTALQSLTRSLAAEWCVHGIRVNSISPGYLDTILNAGDSLQMVRDVWATRCPMGRMGDVEEVVGVVILLLSQRAGRYLTGTDIVVDGGAMCF